MKAEVGKNEKSQAKKPWNSKIRFISTPEKEEFRSQSRTKKLPEYSGDQWIFWGQGDTAEK